MRRVLDHWLERPQIDASLSLALAVGVLLQDWHLGPSAGTLLQTLAGLATATAGFGTLTASLLVSVTPSSRLADALVAVGDRVVRLVMASLVAMVVGAVGFAIAIGFPATSAAPAGILAGASLMTASAIGRSGYLLTLLLTALMPDVPHISSEQSVVVAERAPIGYEPPARP
jgi:hypothetical protein